MILWIIGVPDGTMGIGVIGHLTTLQRPMYILLWEYLPVHFRTNV